MRYERLYDAGIQLHSLKQVLLTHIHGHKFHIKDIAHSVDKSVRTLQRRLADHDLVLSGLMMQVRIDMASDLLAHTDLSILEIARQTGYSESTHFARAFKHVTGNPPGEYRSFNGRKGPSPDLTERCNRSSSDTSFATSSSLVVRI